jgi:polyhydroxyalkanoate synthase subunit PhaC
MQKPQMRGSLRTGIPAGQRDAAYAASADGTPVLLDDLETSIATTPYDVVYTEDRVRLKHYRPTAKRRVRTPLLVIYALINRETMLDLQPDRSVVRKLLDGGIDVYMIDWGYPTRKDRYLTIDDHVNGYIDNIVDTIRKTHHIDAINMMGICMGGTFSVIYAALHPEKVKNLVTTVTPTSFDTDKGLLHLWMKMIDADTMVNTFGNIPGDLLNLGFLMLNPARLVVDKYFGFLKNIEDRRFVENFIRMEKWIFDSPDVPGETFREFIRDCYQRNRLIRSRMNVGGRRVDLDRIRAPLLNFYGRYDHLVPPSACDKLCAAVGSEDTTDICLDTGHIGIYVSSKCQAAFAPKIIQWLEERDRREEQEADIKVTVIRSRAAKRSRRNQTDTPSQPYVADSPEATGTTGQPV